MQKKNAFAGAVAFCLVGAALSVSDSRATVVLLQDLNSSTVFDTQTQAGQNNWVVDGTNQLFQQWFWFHVGNTPEHSLDTLPQTGINVSDTNFNPGNDHIAVQYAGADQFTGTPLRITTIYSLVGGAAGSGSSDLGEQIKIENLGTSAIDFHFYQYVNFDLNGTPGGDTVQIINAPTFNTAVQSEGASSLAETVLTPAPSHHEVHLFPITINALNDGVPTNLDDSLIAGPGNVTWAFQWDFVILPGSSVIISKDKLLQIPEPASFGLLMIGGLLAFRRRRPA